MDGLLFGKMSLFLIPLCLPRSTNSHGHRKWVRDRMENTNRISAPNLLPKVEAEEAFQHSAAPSADADGMSRAYKSNPQIVQVVVPDPLFSSARWSSTLFQLSLDSCSSRRSFFLSPLPTTILVACIPRFERNGDSSRNTRRRTGSVPLM